MKLRNLTFFLLLLMFVPTLFAQRPQRGMIPGGTLKGMVVDSTTQAPIEYANVVLTSKRDNAQVTGTITDENGHFELAGLRPGPYTFEIKFMGYHTHINNNLFIRPRQGDTDVGTIQLKSTVLLLEGVSIEEEKPAMEYKIDKKVINVDKQLTAVSGTAVDVLENVPSVTVDVEGNVELRGSASFTVLLNGRPTVLDPSDVLQQIPASTIDNIEIITNPSAKYDPDGIAGIINVITKKDELQGVNGVVNVNGGLNDKYGGDFLFNYRRSKFNAFLGADYNKRFRPGSTEAENETFFMDTTSFIYSKGNNDREYVRYGLRAGIDLYLTSRDNLSLGYRYGGRDMAFTSDLDYDEWTEPGDIHNLYISHSLSERGGDFYAANMDYTHNFVKKGHELAVQVHYSERNGDEESTNELRDMSGTITSGQRSTEEGPAERLRMKIDYTLPLRENDRFQAGYQNRLSRSTDITEFYDYDVEKRDYIHLSEFSNVAEYEREIHALYTMYAGELGSFGYQAGLRGEYTNRLIELVETREEFNINRWDYFPTLHFSYKYSQGHQVMASYTRRIHRPRGWYLEPFLTWSDAYNVRQGNPGLKPEYIDSYEMGYQKSFGRNLISMEAYYRVTHNAIERVRSVYDANIMLHSIENVGKEYTFGTELMLNVEPLKWWNLNMMGNLYDYRIEGILYDAPFDRGSFNWRIRLNNTIKFSKTTRLQINGIYNSATVSSQGQREGFFATNVAFKQEFLNRNLSLTLQLRDALGTARFENTSEGPDFYHYRLHTHDWPMVTLTVSYKFNNFEQERQRRENGESFEGDEGFGE